MRVWHRWTEEEKEFTRTEYKNNRASLEELRMRFGVSLNAMRGQVVRQGLTKGFPRWTEDDLCYLADNFGRLADEQICKDLSRSKNAIKIIAYRKLNGLARLDGFYTARTVATLLAVSCSKTIVFWRDKGYIKGKRAPFGYGKHKLWSFDYEDIETCLRKRPWLVDPRRMEQSYFRTIVHEEYEKDPWYTAAQAAPFMGIRDPNAVHRYIYRGWLQAVKKPGGPWQGVWIIRKSAIDAFLANDPRKESYHVRPR